MPSQFDTTYNVRFRKPTFDNDHDKKMWELTRECDEIFEMRQPPIPTQEQENKYIDWLQEDFKSDPWVTYRFRKYTANPKRIPWKNQRQIKRQHQYNYILHFVLGSVLFWPVACVIGRRFKTTRAGVPVVHQHRMVHDFPKIDPGLQARRYFRWYSIGSSLLAGFVFAQLMTPYERRCSNAWYNRPDLKPFAAMVDQPEDLTTKKMLDSQYGDRNANLTDGKRSPFYRYFLARDADFTIKENPYRKFHKEDIWDSKVGHYSTYSNNFGDHHQ